MRGKLKKAIEKQFEYSISNRFPEFILYRKTGKGVAWKTSEYRNFIFFFELEFHSKEDGFFINLGWHDDWSDNITLPFPARKFLKLEYNRAFFRMHPLWYNKETGNTKIWWDLDPEYTEAREIRLMSLGKGEDLPFPENLPIETLLPRIPALVDDALDYFANYGIPFLRKLAKTHHIHLPDGWGSSANPTIIT